MHGGDGCKPLTSQRAGFPRPFEAEESLVFLVESQADAFVLLELAKVFLDTAAQLINRFREL
jgi:hypothetical protein